MANLILSSSNGLVKYDPSQFTGEEADGLEKLIMLEREKVDKLLKIWEHERIEQFDLHERIRKTKRYLADNPYTDAEERELAAKFRDSDIAKINLMKSQKLYLSGAQRSLRTSFKVLPLGNNVDTQIVEFANDMLEAAAYRNRLASLMKEVYSEGLDGYGGYHFWEEMETGFHPDTGRPFRRLVTKAESYDPFLTFFDSNHRSEYLIDNRYVESIDYLRARDIIKMFPKARNRINFTKEEHSKWWDFLMSGQNSSRFALIRHDFEDFVNDLFAVATLEERVLRNFYFIFDQELGTVIRKVDDEKEAQAYSESPRYEIDEAEIVCLKVTKALPYKSIILDEHFLPYTHYSHTLFMSDRMGNKMTDTSSFCNTLRGTQKTLNLANANLIEAVTRKIRGGKMSPNKRDVEMLNQHRGAVGTNLYIEEPDLLRDINEDTDTKGLDYLIEQAIRMIGMQGAGVTQPYGQSAFSGESGRHAEQKNAESAQSAYSNLDDFYQSHALGGMGLYEREKRLLTSNSFIQVHDPNRNEFIRSYFPPYSQIPMLRELRADVTVNDGIYATTYKRMQFGLLNNLISLLVEAGYPVSQIIAPSEIIAGSELVGADELAQKADAGLVEMIKTQIEEDRLNQPQGGAVT